MVLNRHWCKPIKLGSIPVKHSEAIRPRYCPDVCCGLCSRKVTVYELNSTELAMKCLS